MEDLEDAQQDPVSDVATAADLRTAAKLIRSNMQFFPLQWRRARKAEYALSLRLDKLAERMEGDG